MIHIITDSACDLNQAIIEKYNITMIPINVYSGEQEYKDKETIMPQELYQRMVEGEFFKTAQIAPAVFEKHFETYAQKGQPCIYIGFSSGISSTFDSAVLAQKMVKEKYPEAVVEVYDSLLTCGMLGMAVQEAAQMAHRGADMKEIVEQLDYFKQKGQHVFTVDNIEYLFKGGRVSRTSAFVGDLLNIKPILDMHEGKLRTLEKIRGRKKAITKLVTHIKERGGDFSEKVIHVGHSNDQESLDFLLKKINEELQPKEIVTEYLGSAVGAHTGPGILSVFFLGK